MSNRLWFRLVLMSLQALGCAGRAPTPAKISEAWTVPAAEVQLRLAASPRPAPPRDWAVMEDSDLDAR